MGFCAGLFKAGLGRELDAAAAHADACSPRCSTTIRMTRSRTSGQYLLCLPIASSSQELEPLDNPERFIGDPTGSSDGTVGPVEV